MSPTATPLLAGLSLGLALVPRAAALAGAHAAAGSAGAHMALRPSTGAIARVVTTTEGPSEEEKPEACVDRASPEECESMYEECTDNFIFAQCCQTCMGEGPNATVSCMDQQEDCMNNIDKCEMPEFAQEQCCETCATCTDELENCNEFVKFCNVEENTTKACCRTCVLAANETMAKAESERMALIRANESSCVDKATNCLDHLEQCKEPNVLQSTCCHTCATCTDAYENCDEMKPWCDEQDTQKACCRTCGMQQASRRAVGVLLELSQQAGLLLQSWRGPLSRQAEAARPRPRPRI